MLSASQQLFATQLGYILQYLQYFQANFPKAALYTEQDSLFGLL